MTPDDLYELHLWSAVPAEHRLRACIAGHLAGEDYDARVQALADACGYNRPNTVLMWTSFRSQVPLNKLQAISRFTGVHINVLLALWIAESADEGQENELFAAVSPRITDGEFALIETARAVYRDEADDRRDP